jgi:deaminated glutathione amidase
VRAFAIQLTTSLRPAENRRLVTEQVAVAAGAGAELVVLPEGTMCAFGPLAFDLRTVAEPLDGPFVTTLAEAASRHQVTVVAGMFEPATDLQRVFNTVVAVGPHGVVASYRKVHLFDAMGGRESIRVAPGDPRELGLFPVGPFTAGIVTCYDLRFPELARALVDRGADLLCVPAHWYNGPGKAQVWETLLRARAIENTAYLVAACKPEDECVGRSAVVDPMGEVLVALGGKEDREAIGADITTERVAQVRRLLPVLEHRRFQVTPREGP